MGLLDDAIREHLELKRRTGAAAGDLARVEREALDPDAGEADGTWDGDLGHEVGVPFEADTPAHPAETGPDGVAPVEVDHPIEPAHDLDCSTVGQETAELDMQTVLGEDLDVPAGSAVGGPSDVGGHSPDPPGEDSMEWEMPAKPGPEASGAA